MEFSFVSFFSSSSHSFSVCYFTGVFFFCNLFKIPHEIANTCLATIYNSIACRLREEKNSLYDLCVYGFFLSCSPCYFVVVSFNSKRYFNILLSSERILCIYVNCFSHSFVCSFVFSFTTYATLAFVVHSFVRLSIIHFTACYGL